MKTKMELIEDHMIKTYEPDLIMSDVVVDVITKDAYDMYLYKPSQTELKWLICKLRFMIADAELKEELKKEEELEWHRWLYDKK